MAVGIAAGMDYLKRRAENKHTAKEQVKNDVQSTAKETVVAGITAGAAYATLHPDKAVNIAKTVGKSAAGLAAKVGTKFPKLAGLAGKAGEILKAAAKKLPSVSTIANTIKGSKLYGTVVNSNIAKTIGQKAKDLLANNSFLKKIVNVVKKDPKKAAAVAIAAVGLMVISKIKSNHDKKEGAIEQKYQDSVAQK